MHVEISQNQVHSLFQMIFRSLWNIFFHGNMSRSLPVSIRPVPSNTVVARRLCAFLFFLYTLKNDLEQKVILPRFHLKYCLNY